MLVGFLALAAHDAIDHVPSFGTVPGADIDLHEHSGHEHSVANQQNADPDHGQDHDCTNHAHSVVTVAVKRVDTLNTAPLVAIAIAIFPIHLCNATNQNPCCSSLPSAEMAFCEVPVYLSAQTLLL